MFDNHTTVRKRIARLAVAAVAAAVGVVGLSASPAAADRPLEISGTNMFTAVNPCTGEVIDITIDYEGRIHLHDNGNVVAHFTRTGTTSDGYVLDHGLDNGVVNSNVLRGAVNDTWRNADGSAFQVHAHFTERTGELVVDSFRLRCIRA